MNITEVHTRKINLELSVKEAVELYHAINTRPKNTDEVGSILSGLESVLTSSEIN